MQRWDSIYKDSTQTGPALLSKRQHRIQHDSRKTEAKEDWTTAPAMVLRYESSGQIQNKEDDSAKKSQRKEAFYQHHRILSYKLGGHIDTIALNLARTSIENAGYGTRDSKVPMFAQLRTSHFRSI